MSSTFSNIFSSETTGLIEAKFHVEPPWDGGTKVCSNDPSHMTKTAAMPIYGKKLKKYSSAEPNWPMSFKLGMLHWKLKYYQVCSNDDPVLTFDLFTERSNLLPYAFVWQKACTFFRNSED